MPQSFLPQIVRTLTALVMVVSAASVLAAEAGPEPVPEVRPGILQGYLTAEAYPDSLALLPPPPAAGSPEQAADEAFSERLLALKGTPRYALAARDDNLLFPAAADTFACALGFTIAPESTPYLYQLLRRSLTDAGLATYAAKLHYERQRPFIVNGAPNCAPEAEQEMLAHDPSYPSGHTAIGWAWALILTSLVPERADEILARGLAFGESRMVCNVHWPSDVTAGRTIGAATVAVLRANPDFEHDFDAAGAEVAALRGGEHSASGNDPGASASNPADVDNTCDMESRALAVDLDALPAPQ
ncbi:MAG: phosphatase PAP2 family protein [Pseudomonadales bacterium]|jgi:acid phosphatase (class A)